MRLLRRLFVLFLLAASACREQGEPIRVEEVRFLGFETLPAARLDELKLRAPLRRSERLDRQVVQTTRDLALNELKDHGFPYASVEVSEQAGSVSRRVVLTLSATPGPIAYFGSIEIAGNRRTSGDTIRRYLTYRPGELFRLSQLQESQRRLYALGSFERVNIEALAIDPRPAEVHTRVEVAEGKRSRGAWNIGFGTEEKARAEVEWRYVNFLGGVRTVGAHAKWSSLDRGARLDFMEPYLFSPNVSLGLQGYRWSANEPTYTLASAGGRFIVWRQAGRRDPLRRPVLTTLSLSLISEFEQYSIADGALGFASFRDELPALGLDRRTGKGEGTLAAIALDARRDTTANRVEATGGYSASVHFEQAGRWLPGSFVYEEVMGEGRRYVSLGRLGVLASRLRVGSIRARETGGVPIFKRFFLGGSSSLRGWGRFEVGAAGASGVPIGGRTLLEMTAEARRPIVGGVGAVAFLDAGNVWAKAWDVRLRDLRYAIGAGLRYATPMGPVRLDVGYQLTPIVGLLVDGKPERRRWRIHFSIGPTL